MVVESVLGVVVNEGEFVEIQYDEVLRVGRDVRKVGVGFDDEDVTARKGKSDNNRRYDVKGVSSVVEDALATPFNRYLDSRSATNPIGCTALKGV